MESLRWFTMLISMALAGVASQYYSARHRGGGWPAGVPDGGPVGLGRLEGTLASAARGRVPG